MSTGWFVCFVIFFGVGWGFFCCFGVFFGVGFCLFFFFKATDCKKGTSHWASPMASL